MSHNLLLSVVGLLIFHVVGLVLLHNLRWLRWPLDRRPLPRRTFAVTVIVPARNEQADVADCLRLLLGQE
jgi:hypothetical protein